MRMYIRYAIIGFATCSIVSSLHTSENKKSLNDTITHLKTAEDLATAVGLQLYIYALPLYTMQKTMNMMTNEKGISAYGNAPFGTFGHARRLLTPQDNTIVTPNNDTFYSSAWIDVEKEPYVLHLPKVNSQRYYSCQLLDAWTNIFGLINHKTRGNADQDYIIVGPSHQEKVPSSFKKLVSSTNLAWILVRFLVNDNLDVPNVIALQDKLAITPLSIYLEKGSIAVPIKNPSILNNNNKLADNLLFFDSIGKLLKKTTVPTGEQCMKTWFNYLEIPEQGIDETINKGTLTGLSRVKEMAEEIICDYAKTHGINNNNWIILMIPNDYGNDYLLRAAITYKGLGALPTKEALYAAAHYDIEQEELSGSNQYVIHFAAEELPPAEAFWSITMYDQKTFGLVNNSINRYSIGDRTPGLQYNEDGSLDIYIQHERPKNHREKNWLPAPEKAFYLVLRLYNPQEEAFNGSWKIPGIYKSLVK